MAARIKHRFPLLYWTLHAQNADHTSLSGLGTRDCVTDPVQNMNICRAMLPVVLLPCNVHSHMKVHFYQFCHCLLQKMLVAKMQKAQRFSNHLLSNLGM